MGTEASFCPICEEDVQRELLNTHARWTHQAKEAGILYDVICVLDGQSR